MYVINVFESRTKYFTGKKPFFVKEFESIAAAKAYLQKIQRFRPQYFCSYFNDSNFKEFYSFSRE